MTRQLAAAAAGLLAGACAVLPAQALAGDQIYSYDPSSPAARTLAPTGLSFEFQRGLFGSVRVRRVIQTGERGAAELAPGGDKDLGAGGLAAALAGARPAGGLYEIRRNTEDGAAFVQAVCPGAERAWLLIGPLDRFRSLTVQAVGRDPGAPSAHACATLEFEFRNDWRLPERAPPRPRMPRSNLG